jgi:hypothetical protein
MFGLCSSKIFFFGRFGMVVKEEGRHECCPGRKGISKSIAEVAEVLREKPRWLEAEMPTGQDGCEGSEERNAGDEEES